jgi:preprotein translocase subunit SecD
MIRRCFLTSFAALAAALLAVAAAQAEPLTLTVLNATVTDVSPTGSPADAEPALSISLSPESTAAFAAFTAANIGKTVEFRYDGKVLAAGVIRDHITNGRLRIGGGDYTRGELRTLANLVPVGRVTMQAEVVEP